MTWPCWRGSSKQLDGTQQPGSAQLFNNHIPVDPRLDGAIAITKTTSLVNVSRGQMVPYTITLTNSFSADLSDVTIVDRFPPGFRYVEGSARIDGVKTEPQLVGRELRWSGLTLATDGRHELKLLMAVGAGVSEGEFTNRAQAMSALTGGVLSEEATATVRLVPDPTFDCTDVMRPQWRPRIGLLLTELQKAPAVLRLSYVADVEEESLVNRRLDALKGDIMTAWEEMDCCYELVIEPEIFWRLGAPQDKPREAGK